MSDTGPVRRRRIAGERSRAVVAAPTDRQPTPTFTEPEIDPVEADTSTPRVRLPPLRKPVARTATARTGSAKSAATPAPRKPRTATRFAGLRPPRSALRWFVPLVVVAALIVAAGPFIGIRGISQYRDDRAEVASGQQAAARAGTAMETIFSYNYQSLDGYLSDSQAFMTDAFGKEFAKVAPTLNQLAPQRKIDVQARVRSAAPLECGTACSPDKADVLVFYDQVRTTADTTGPQNSPYRVVVSMAKVDGSWLVSNIRRL